MKFNIGFITFSLLFSSATWTDTPQDKKSLAEKTLRQTWMDLSVSPYDDFYSYANGTWKKNHPIPPEYASWGSFNILNEKVQKQLHEMLINFAANTKAKPASMEQKIGDFFFSGMDEKSINELGASPLQSEFSKINAIKNLQDLQQELVSLHQIGVDVLFSFGSMQDFKDSKNMIAAATQGGLGLPDRDYYLKTEPKFKKIRDAYLVHVGKIFELLGDNAEQAKKQAQMVMSIETQLATASMSQVEQRDPYAVYHMLPLVELQKRTPNFSWTNYFKAFKLDNLKQVNCAMPNFFKAMNSMLQTISIDDWKVYFRWRLIDDYSSYLSQPFVDQNFKMAAEISGTKKILPRWKRVLGTINSAMGFGIGRMYVEKYFPEDSRQEVLDILKNLRFVLKDDINTLTWMTPQTRQAALKKLDLLEERIGYPTKWRDYSKLIINRGPYVLNVMNANVYLVNRDLNKIDKPADRLEWAMSPQTVNAYYDPSMNNINMPAAILQFPFFDPHAPAAINYGALGFVMGHEMTHAFDDQGSQFDAQGNLKNWWTPEDLKKFKKATQCIEQQFSEYTVADNMHVQGKLVVGEAAADLGGVTLAYRAFHHSKAFKNAKTINGFTPDQQFFLGAAHVWAMNMRPEQAQNQVTTDPHPPAMYRVNGTMANMPEFQEAFHVPQNSPMVNKTRCKIW